MTASCSCTPGACHGGHTINMGMPRLTDEQLHNASHGVISHTWLNPMATELLAARARITELEAEHNQARAVIDRVRIALAGHPRCDVVADADPVSCGWKHAVADVQAALDALDIRGSATPGATE